MPSPRSARLIRSRAKTVTRPAAELLRVFFVDPKTRMNPSLQYAQAIPGVSPGRGYGIIDTLQLTDVPLAIVAIERSPALLPQRSRV
jgi:Alginate lyase